MIAIDSSVLIDLLGDGERADAAEDSLRQALARGPVVVCAVVVSEVVSGLAKFGSGGALLSALEEAGVAYNAVESRAAVRAGEPPTETPLPGLTAARRTPPPRSGRRPPARRRSRFR